jgi:hypothetical protein
MKTDVSDDVVNGIYSLAYHMLLSPVQVLLMA